LEAYNQEKKDQINKLAKKIAALEAEQEAGKEPTFVLPKPSNHRSGKKHQGNKKSMEIRCGLTID
jgi:hypothetical protein